MTTCSTQCYTRPATFKGKKNISLQNMGYFLAKVIKQRGLALVCPACHAKSTTLSAEQLGRG